MEPINRPDLAEARLKLALNYNPNYALAHYDLWQLYLKTGDEPKSMDHQNKFKLLWQQADEDVKRIYGFWNLKSKTQIFFSSGTPEGKRNSETSVEFSPG